MAFYEKLSHIGNFERGTLSLRPVEMSLIDGYGIL